MQKSKKPTRVNYSWTAEGGNAVATAFVKEEADGLYRGGAYIIIAGETVGPWPGGQYGIGTEWDDPDQAIKDLAVFLYHEVEKHPIEKRDKLLDNIVNGFVRGSTSEDFRYDPAEDVLKGLQEVRTFFAAGMERVKIEPGTQLDLFG